MNRVFNHQPWEALSFPTRLVKVGLWRLAAIGAAPTVLAYTLPVVDVQLSPGWQGLLRLCCVLAPLVAAYVLTMKYENAGVHADLADLREIEQFTARDPGLGDQVRGWFAHNRSPRRYDVGAVEAHGLAGTGRYHDPDERMVIDRIRGQRG
ncbi:hypothetical protein J7369_11245 [Xanthomonas phaseoli pv. dieffenbachiae]|uniref:hypothetical protein n=1 Tax=Xanthomonas TaxID=338 RepID=UPI001ADC9741|nr:hypothetical protein [Xanthomonas phaseoli]MBO9898272.1 hypothetical protein [Xanthomonas phaseoli pv. dieffenbachiae]CAD7740465.1 hypothetical protein LMG31884_46700 [Xanthomonas hydrangeae]CAD7740469.1 hypothetical protein LMG31884_46700 [Xanthomonas hydrangeae]